MFRLPPRSAVWSPLVASPDNSSTFYSVDGLFPSNSILPILREAVSIITPLLLSENQSPKILPKQRKSWTKAERVTAGKATTATSIEHLTQLVECTSITLIYNTLIPLPYTSSEMLMRVVNVKRAVTLTYHILYWKSKSIASYLFSI